MVGTGTAVDVALALDDLEDEQFLDTYTDALHRVIEVKREDRARRRRRSRQCGRAEPST